ncbi:hypothetical protein M2310_003188 [Rhizobium leguminosarum]|uniref:Uncharacterized protein n=1 Tax=Rhizobium esperanzae TaxID=1967781 RepID=A0A7W6XVT6_9HYPH|nr:hypothetical protein [Rhizobium esperanzae]MDH6202507.1 hypothetical protein [Rhizobium leguminosarum]
MAFRPIMNGSKPRRAAAESEPDTGGDTKTRADDITEHCFRHGYRDMFVKAWVNDPADDVVEDIEGGEK